MEEAEGREEVKPEEDKKKSKSQKTKKIFGWIGFALSLVLLIGLTVNALLAVFVSGYYPTFGGYRLFSIVTDSMEPEIPTGNMIVGRVPESEEEIGVGTVITYELRQGGSTVLITHRVIAVNVDEVTGIVSYTTQGDNAGGVDAVRPAFSDVVGIYTGQRCAFFGYFFGFLQSVEGAIALIVILLIIAITMIIVHFVNLVSVWRKIAVNALQKSGAMLSETQVEGLGVIADVIGIISKDPVDKADVTRKDKKLKWFIKTGALPKRPYNDDFDENTAFAGGGKLDLGLPASPAAQEAAAILSEASSNNEAGGILRERYEKMSYRFTLLAKLIRLNPQSKEWYSEIKNELLSYRKVRVRMGNKFENFMLGRRTVARFAVRGKTLCFYFAGNPSDYEKSKYAVQEVKSNTPCLYRIRSALRAKYACALIGDLMKGLGVEKNADYEEKDFYLPYEGIVSLMQKGLIKRNVTSVEKTYRLVEVDEKGEEVQAEEALVAEHAEDEAEAEPEAESAVTESATETEAETTPKDE